VSLSGCVSLCNSHSVSVPVSPIMSLNVCVSVSLPFPSFPQCSLSFGNRSHTIDKPIRAGHLMGIYLLHFDTCVFFFFFLFLVSIRLKFVCAYGREEERQGRRKGRKFKLEELFDTIRNTPSFSLNNFFTSNKVDL